MTKFTFTAEIERGDMIEVQVAYTVSRYYAATYSQPAEGGECQIDSVKLDGVEITLTDAEEVEILRQCEERAGDDVSDEAAAHADYLYDQYRDRRMEL